MTTKDLKRILVFRIGHLGDTLISLPAFRALRDDFPDAHIALLSNVNIENPQYVTARSVLPAEGLFDEWISYPSETSGLGKVAAFAGLFRKIRDGKFDAVGYLMTRNRTSESLERDLRFFRLAGIKTVFGAKHLANNLLDPNDKAPLAAVEPEWKFLFDCVALDGIGTGSTPIMDAASTDAEIAAADQWIAANCREVKSGLIAVAPSAKWESKMWTTERFASVVKRLIDKYSVFPVVFGGPEDRELGDRLIGKWGSGANASGELDVRTAIAALGKCDLYLGNDTGTMHMAAAAGTRCVGIFAAIDRPNRWSPFGKGHSVFRESVECEGCNAPVCFNQHRCLDLIPEEPVFRACDDILKELAGR